MLSREILDCPLPLPMQSLLRFDFATSSNLRMCQYGKNVSRNGEISGNLGARMFLRLVAMRMLEVCLTSSKGI